MPMNADVLQLLLRELDINLACAAINRTDIVLPDDPVLAAIHAAGVRTSTTPTVDEVRQTVKRALESFGGY